MIFKSLDMARVPSLWSTRQKSYVWLLLNEMHSIIQGIVDAHSMNSAWQLMYESVNFVFEN